MNLDLEQARHFGLGLGLYDCSKKFLYIDNSHYKYEAGQKYAWFAHINVLCLRYATFDKYLKKIQKPLNTRFSINKFLLATILKGEFCP